MNKDIDLIIDELLIERGEHPSRVRNPIYSEERDLVKKTVEKILSPSSMEGKGLNIKKLSEKVDDALAKETEESLNEFLNEVKAKEEGKTPLKGWVNVNKSILDGSIYTSIIYSTKELADNSCNSASILRLACIDLSQHYEGGGL